MHKAKQYCLDFLVAMALLSPLAVMAADQRADIRLAAEQREVVLTEMRGFLSAVQQITDALARQDMKAAAVAARSVGSVATHDMPVSLKQALPLEFKQLGFSVHHDFDQLAMDAESIGDVRHSMTQMSRILQKCVACHATYQLNVKP